MKYTKIISLLLCLAALCSFAFFASCDSGEDGGTEMPEITTTEPVLKDEVTTTAGEAEDDTPNDEESYETDSMSSAECFDFAARKLFSAVDSLKNGFFPEIFGSEQQSDGGKLALSCDSLSLFGSPILNNAFSLSGGYARNDNGFISEGKLKNANELSYQLYVTPEGAIYMRFPQLDENTFIGLDTNIALGDASQKNEADSTVSSVTNGSLFEILDEVFGDATDKLISEESADITVLDKDFKGARKLTFKYVMTSASVEKYGVSEVNVVLYVAKGTLVRAEFELVGIDLGLDVDMLEEDGTLNFDASLSSAGEKTFGISGEQKDSSGSMTFSFGEAQSEMGNMGFSLSYDRSVKGNVTVTDYALGIVLSAGANELTVAIPIHTELTREDSGAISYKLSIDTVKDKIPEMLAKVCVSFEITRLPDGSETVATLPDFTDENTLYVTDESDREALAAYFESMNEQFPDIKSSILDILKLFGFNGAEEETLYLEGTYAPGGIASLVTLTFEADGKASCSVIGYGTDGTYVINGNEITLDFGTGHNLTGTFSFENKGDSIVINGTEYFKK